MPPLHSRYTLLVTFGTQTLRYGVGAVAATGLIVAALRVFGQSPAEVRARVPLIVVLALIATVAAAAVGTWRRLRRRRYYYRSRYRRYS